MFVCVCLRLLVYIFHFKSLAIMSPSKPNQWMKCCNLDTIESNDSFIGLKIWNHVGEAFTKPLQRYMTYFHFVWKVFKLFKFWQNFLWNITFKTILTLKCQIRNFLSFTFETDKENEQGYICTLLGFNQEHTLQISTKLSTWFFYPKNNHISDKNHKMTGECQNQEWIHR